LAAGPNFLGCESIKRRRGHAKNSQIQIKLAAMMDFVFCHGTKAFPHRHFDLSHVSAFGLKIGVGQLAEDGHRLGMQAFHERENIFETFSQLLAVRSTEGRAEWFGFPRGPRLATDR
jgi:hypothetical protein